MTVSAFSSALLDLVLICGIFFLILQGGTALHSPYRIGLSQKL